MRLEKLKVQDFKRVMSVEIALADINILVGSNGGGKSSIIQATHLACCVMRQSDRVESRKTSTVGIEELDYLPTDNYKMLGHKAIWGNKAETSSSQVEFTFSGESEVEITATCTLRSARNAGISITGSVPNELTDVLRRKRHFFSAYVPGISGIPNREERKAKKVIQKSCSYGDSNIILRNVLLLLNKEDSENIRQIEAWIEEIAGPVKILVSHDDEKDLTIDCRVEIDGDQRPLELIGTGFLQLMQIFSYVLLFRPGILLIDEPDTHLHPTVQEKLVQVLGRVAAEKDLRILMTTHSPFIVRGAPMGSKVFWVKDGVIESENRRSVELALGWGAFGRKILLVSEDTNTTLLRKIVAQWPELDRCVAWYPGTGFKNLPTPNQAADISDALDHKFRVLVHRDRDSLTDDEVAQLERAYQDKGVDLWMPHCSDVEAYFCVPQFVAGLMGISEVDAQDHLDTAIDRLGSQIQEQFASQRATHNRELYAEGGSPPNAAVWDAASRNPLRGAKGKTVFRAMKNVVPGGRFSEEAVANHSFVSEVAPDLKAKLQSLLVS